jgi:DNA invertase Pin-like site-specific DNA recombinase
MDRICMYLRKSRADLEAEARGEGETLAKHKRTLMKYAREKGLNIVNIREEIVSGDSIFHRPEMQALLREVEERRYDAVLCMDLDRLGRGNMQEQGLIFETFRQTGTKIITPQKVYDLNDETDEFMSEVQAFFARQELKMINRRMQRGRIASVEEGNYIGTRPPYGYNIAEDEKGRYLVPHPEQAPVVKLIFELYTNDDPHQRMGTNKIANHLNELDIPSYTGRKWIASSVLTIIKNKVYTGVVQWGKKEYKKSKVPGKRREQKMRPQDQWVEAKGKHEPLISLEVWEKAQEILRQKYHVPYQLENGITNPLAGIIRCAKCGMSMILRPFVNQQPHIKCYNRFCDNKSSRLAYVEEALLRALDQWMDSYVIEYGKRKRKDSHMIEVRKQALETLKRELQELEQQKERLHDFLERGVYDVDTYLERSKVLADRIATTKESIARAELELMKEQEKEKAQKDVIPKLKNVVKLYRKSKDPAKKNALLKSVVQYATYRKEKWQRNDEFELVLVPKFK